MFELDLLVRMKIIIPDDLNTRLENGEPQAYKIMEDMLQRFIPNVSKVQIEDAGPHNDAGNWEASKFHE